MCVILRKEPTTKEERQLLSTKCSKASIGTNSNTFKRQIVFQHHEKTTAYILSTNLGSRIYLPVQ